MLLTNHEAMYGRPVATTIQCVWGVGGCSDVPPFSCWDPNTTDDNPFLEKIKRSGGGVGVECGPRSARNQFLLTACPLQSLFKRTWHSQLVLFTVLPKMFESVQ